MEKLLTSPAKTLPDEKRLPILYSFRRCPYAMRARLAMVMAQVTVELREIELRHKPEALLLVSPKGTVPVLQLANGEVIEESLDIMAWATQQHPKLKMERVSLQQAESLILWNDGDFKYYLDRYKYADRYPEFPVLAYRQQGERFLTELQLRLQRRRYLGGPEFSLVDAAIAPFIRQFAAVDSDWFAAAPYPAVQAWLQRFVASPVFEAVMGKYPPWQANDPPRLFAGLLNINN